MKYLGSLTALLMAILLIISGLMVLYTGEYLDGKYSKAAEIGDMKYIVGFGQIGMGVFILNAIKGYFKK
jgi:hypothetical protein